MFFLIEIEEEGKRWDILTFPVGHTIVFENTIILIRYVHQKDQ